MKPKPYGECTGPEWAMRLACITLDAFLDSPLAGEATDAESAALFEAILDLALRVANQPKPASSQPEESVDAV